MVNQVCEKDELLQVGLEATVAIAGNAPISVRQSKRSIYQDLSLSLADGMLFEVEAYNRMVPTEDRREGVTFFNEKRRPVFRER